MSANREAIVIFPISGQFGAIRISDVLSVKLIFSLKVTFYLTKTENKIKRSLARLSHYCFE